MAGISPPVPRPHCTFVHLPVWSVRLGRSYLAVSPVLTPPWYAINRCNVLNYRLPARVLLLYPSLTISVLVRPV